MAPKNKQLKRVYLDPEGVSSYSVVVGGPLQQWQADLVDLSNLKNYNDGMTFHLTVIDVSTKARSPKAGQRRFRQINDSNF